MSWYGNGDVERRGQSASTDVDARSGIRRLVKQIKAYDALRVRLEREGGSLGDVSAVTRLLSQKVPVITRWDTQHVALVELARVKRALADVQPDLHIETRQRHTRMPVYYLCRIDRDYWAPFGLVLEDVYRSPGYPMPDERVVRLMGPSGRETSWIRLSPFRSAAADCAARHRSDVDTLLADVGIFVLGAAWHDDQRLGWRLAEMLDLRAFPAAVELVHLVLGADLCLLRARVSPVLLEFFEDVYPHPPIREFLAGLTGLDGNALNDVPPVAHRLYSRLVKAFQTFLAVEVPWGRYDLPTPFWKIAAANFARLELVAPVARSSEEVAAAGVELEATAGEVLTALREASQDDVGLERGETGGPSGR